MKTKRILLGLLLSIVVMGNNLFAQKQFSIRTNFGITSGYKAVDGFQFGFDLGIPLFKSVEISPTFTFLSSLPMAYHDNWWSSTDGPSTAWSGDGPLSENPSGNIMGSVDLLIIFRPFRLIDNPGFSRHDLGLGLGYGLKAYAITSAQYEVTNGSYTLLGFNTKTDVGFEPYYGKIFYNYYLSKSLFLGISAAINAYDGEGVALFGIQLGVSLDRNKN